MRFPRSAAPWGAALLAACGCASVPAAPFQDFQASFNQARGGLEAEAGRDADWTREAEVQALADDNRALLSARMIKEADGGRWSMDRPPAYWAARRTAAALEEMDAAFSGYASLLAGAASGRPADDARFDAMASGLNQGLRDLGAPAGQVGPVAGTAAGLSEALRRYAATRLTADLRKAVRESQPWVEAYAARCAELAVLIRADLKAAYADQAASIQRHWDDKRAPGRAGLTRSLFNLNEEYVDAMSSLDALSDFYARLPAAHRALGEDLGRGLGSRAALAALYDSAARVARLTRRLEKEK